MAEAVIGVLSYCPTSAAGNIERFY